MKDTERDKYEASIHSLQISIGLFRCIFSKYESFEANGLKRVSVHSIVRDFKDWEKSDKSVQELVSKLRKGAKVIK